MQIKASVAKQGVETINGIKCLGMVKIMAQLQKQTLQKLQTVCLVVSKTVYLATSGQPKMGFKQRLVSLRQNSFQTSKINCFVRCLFNEFGIIETI